MATKQTTPIQQSKNLSTGTPSVSSSQGSTATSTTTSVPNNTSFQNNSSPQPYYDGNDYGGYQYITLEDVCNNFMATYVGDEKILGRTRKSDVCFHAHRALQELHYDTFKSNKSQEIEVCSNLKMPLPHDYVNYVKLTRVDSKGIEHVLYPNRKTSNPFAIEQVDTDCDDCGDSSSSYQFEGTNLSSQKVDCDSSEVTCTFDPTGMSAHNGVLTSHAKFVKQFVNQRVSSLGGTGSMSDADGEKYWQKWMSNVDTYCNCLKNSSASTNCGNYVGWKGFNGMITSSVLTALQSNAGWSNLQGTSGLLSSTIANSGPWPSVTSTVAASTPSSNAWDNFTSGPNSAEPSEEKWKDHYGQKYGLDPEHANSNGTYYIDEASGIIHFSSNLSGETIILKYISDGHGTDAELIVPKLAEEAMYKWIAHGCLSAKANTPEYLVARFKKEKYAETRKAKIRLSNIKLEEITQVFRGKAKHIKH